MSTPATLDVSYRPVSAGPLLTYHRLTAGHTQAELARRAGIDHSLLNRYEAGERRPSRARVLKLAHALGLSADETDELLQTAGWAPATPTYRRLVVLFAACGDANRRRKAARLLDQAVAVLAAPIRYDD
jgi:transcriptional regulator with XRE-family HTH domain